MPDSLFVESAAVDSVAVADSLLLNVPFSREAFGVFSDGLSVMLFGMAGIFVFMLVFYLLVKLLDFLHKNKEV